MRKKRLYYYFPKFYNPPFTINNHLVDYKIKNVPNIVC